MEAPQDTLKVLVEEISLDGAPGENITPIFCPISRSTHPQDWHTIMTFTWNEDEGHVGVSHSWEMNKE